MKIFESIQEFQNWRMSQSSVSIGFVPTMGDLHAGHVSLISRARQDNDLVVVSVYVNPTQFNDPKDYEKYARPLTKDLETARNAKVDAVLLPRYDEIYADQYRFRLQESHLSQILCGASRPGHFDGVLTIVLKLFMIVRPHRAYFGEKDYQQLQLISDMAKSLFLAVEVIGLPTVRESDGLAMSSRNSRLSREDRALAPSIYRELQSKKSLAEIRDHLEAAGFRVDYLEEHFGRRFAAVFLGDVRLIDNV